MTPKFHVLMIIFQIYSGSSNRRCGEELIYEHWKALSSHGIYPSELKHLSVSNPEKFRKMFSEMGKFDRVAEGGTNVAEFNSEVRLVRQAHQAALTAKTPFKKMCETGMNTGVSSIGFLCATPDDVTMHSFDLGSQFFSRNISGIVNKRFPNRHSVTFGDSNVTLREAISAKILKCDFVFIDGGHSFDIALSDIENFQKLSYPGTYVVVENCNVFGLNHGWGGMTNVNNAYIHSVQRKIIDHREQVSLGDCMGNGGEYCRELCVGVYL